MSALETTDSTITNTVLRQRHSHFGLSIPTVAWPTLALGMGALTLFGVATIAAIDRFAPMWTAIPLNAVAVYWMFAVAHEALHGSLSSSRTVNAVVGRVAWFFVVPMASFSSFGYAHNQHHLHTNHADKDPDMFATHGPAWQLPFRWALMDFFYSAWFCRQLKGRLRRSWRRPVAELTESGAASLLSVVGICIALRTNNFWTLAVVLLIPQRVALVLIGWWFDWLPHHALGHAARGNPYRATRTRVGMEWLLTPVTATFNYHLVHHLHPQLPFYRSPQVWRRNIDYYLEHDSAIATIFGRQLTPDEFRAWQQAHPRRARS